MVWLWLGLGAAIGIAALVLVILVLDYIDNRVCTRNAAIRKREHDAETAMVRTVQDAIGEMFNSVRRQR